MTPIVSSPPLAYSEAVNNYKTERLKASHRKTTRYALDPVAFVREVLRPKEIAPYQEEILNALVQHRRVAVRGPHGLGKTALAAWCVLWFASVHQDTKIPTTASAWRQLSKFLWPEIHKWARRADWSKVGVKPEFLQLNLRVGQMCEAFAVASDNPDMIEGAHAEHLLYVFDEAKAIPNETFDAAEGAFAIGNCVLGDTNVSAVDAELVSRRWYKGEIIQIQTASGHNLSVTPNHPILTCRGWVRAHSLQPTDQVVSCHNAKSLMSRIEPNAIQIPTCIQNIFELYGILNNTISCLSNMLTSENLDSALANSEINIESPNSLLCDGRVSMFNENFVNIGFMDRTNESFSLSGLSATRKVNLCFDIPAIAMPALSRARARLFGIFSNINSLRFANVSALNAPFIKALADNAIRDAVFSGECSNGFATSEFSDKLFAVRRKPLWMSAPHSTRLDSVSAKVVQDGTASDVELFAKLNRIAPSNVFADQILNLNRRQFEGHVYDLQTKTHWFTATNYNTNSDSNTIGGIVVHNCYALAISTPGDRAGRFYDIHRRALGFEDWWVRHITIDEAMAAGRVSPEWVEARKRQWGEQSPIYQARVLGEFPEQSEDTLISLSWIEAARERELRPLGEIIAGLDVARFGDDSSCLLARQGDCALSADIWSGHDTMQTTGKAKASGAHVNVDEIGVGAGVADRLRELNYPHSAINVGNAARDADKFINLRTELYWLMRERFQDGRIDLTRLGREVYDRLSGELTSMKYKYQSDGRLRLEEKAEMKKRIGHSPDLADALVLAFAGEKQEAVIEMIRAHEYTINEMTF